MLKKLLSVNIYVALVILLAPMSINAQNKDTLPVDLNVNKYVWYSAINLAIFMPIDIIDPFSGTITTQWHSITSNPNEQYKMNIHIKESLLTSEVVSVHVFKRVKSSNGEWSSTTISDDISRKIENTIIYNAKVLRDADIKE